MIRELPAYWLHTSGKLIEVPRTHIVTIREKPNLFKLKLKDIDAVFDKYGEKYNVEGKARKEIMVDLIKKGWIRLRKHIRSGTWYANVNKLDNKNMKAIQKWMGEMIAAGYEYKSTPIIISDVLDSVGNMKKITMENVMERKTTFGEILNENYDDISLRSILKESGLSRVKTHMENHDCGIITAERYKEGCGGAEDTVLTSTDNKKRNKQLLAKLQSAGYGITKVKGSYIENYGSKDAKEVGEWAFFVVDLKDSGKLQKDLKVFGKHFMQDSILFIPKGGTYAELHGTSNCPQAYPGMGQKQKFGKRGLGKAGEFFTRINGRVFNFESVDNIMESTIDNHFVNTNWLGKMGIKAVANLEDWRDVQL